MILIHISHSKINKLKKVEQEKEPNFKPMGLWYAPGKTWSNWVKENAYGTTRGYYYVVVLKYTKLDKPDINKILQISNTYEFDQFLFIYGQVVSLSNDTILIKWNLVAQDFGGIEIIPFLKSRYNNIGKLHPFYQGLGAEIIDEYQKHGFNLDDINLTWYDL
jgi:hypothetical protein